MNIFMVINLTLAIKTFTASVYRKSRHTFPSFSNKLLLTDEKKEKRTKILSRSVLVLEKVRVAHVMRLGKLF